MTEETVERAIRVAIRNAHTAGRLTNGSPQSLESAISYAMAMLLPLMEARVQQGIEEAYANWKAQQPELSL